jgi:HD-GYP domain-containing protein (c-di-GMP phosphodiesterase class II)/ribonuclease BN (tRNA processing enzyme)
MLKDDIKLLGVSGDKSGDSSPTSLQVGRHVVIDAGNILQSLGEEASNIEHIFLTHSHLDHIVDIPFWIDTYYDTLKKPLKVYALKETIRHLKEHIFNYNIWPDFSEIYLANRDEKSIEFIEIKYGEVYSFDDVTLEPISVNHTVETCGYIIKKETFSTLFATDTYITDTIWDRLNSDLTINSLIIDVSFPSSYDKLAKESKHLTPKLLLGELKKLHRNDLSIYITHIKSSFFNEVKKELEVLDLLKGDGRVLKDSEYLKSLDLNQDENKTIMQISTALSQEKDLSKILEMILNEAINYTNSEGGTIYLKDEKDELHFKSVVNKKLNIYLADLNSPTIPLYKDGLKNIENVSAICAVEKNVINIPDVYLYNMDGVSFDGVKKFDSANDYRTKSMLVIPMVDQDGEIVGVLQLINKNISQNMLPYNAKDVEVTRTYTNWAASAITKNILIDTLEELLFSFLESISVAIASKSPYGHGHISRVAKMVVSISKKINEDYGKFYYKAYSKDELKELEVAALMHDIGKIVTPEHIIDKSTKLETIYDRVSEVETRFNLAKMSMRVENIKNIDHDLESKLNLIDDDILFIKKINSPVHVMSDQDMHRLELISKKRFIMDEKEVGFLTDDEYHNLSVRYGTLTHEEREVINNHAKVSLDMLNMLTFPKKYSRVKEIALAHHEKLNGSGYPLGLKAEEISFEGRLLAVIDIFEALTASDRPYKDRNSKEKTFKILYSMADAGELDRDIIEFIEDINLYEEFIENEEVKELV